MSTFFINVLDELRGVASKIIGECEADSKLVATLAPNRCYGHSHFEQHHSKILSEEEENRIAGSHRFIPRKYHWYASCYGLSVDPVYVLRN